MARSSFGSPAKVQSFFLEISHAWSRFRSIEMVNCTKMVLLALWNWYTLSILSAAGIWKTKDLHPCVFLFCYDLPGTKMIGPHPSWQWKPDTLWPYFVSSSKIQNQKHVQKRTATDGKEAAKSRKNKLAFHRSPELRQYPKKLISKKDQVEAALKQSPAFPSQTFPENANSIEKRATRVYISFILSKRCVNSAWKVWSC